VRKLWMAKPLTVCSALVAMIIGCSSHPPQSHLPQTVASTDARQGISRKIAGTADESRLTRAIERGTQNLLKRQITDELGTYWMMPTRLGLHFSSQYYILLKWLGRTKTQLNSRELLTDLLSEQQSDGSWYQVRDLNTASEAGGPVLGSLDATIFDYWALKVLRAQYPESAADIGAALTRAQAYILSHGGLEQAGTFAKVFLALSGNTSWNAIPFIPLTLFRQPLQPLVVNKFAQWIIPHLKPLAYMKSHRLVKKLGPEFNLQELSIKPAKPIATGAGSHLERFKGDSQYLIEEVIAKSQLPRGSWGGYSLATLFSIIAIDDYLISANDKISEELKTQLKSQVEHGHEFVETLYFTKSESAYHGVLDDSSYWDTMLALRGLIESDYPVEKLRPAADFVVRQQQPADGGIPFGYDFWPYSDVDDTVEILLALKKMPGYEVPIGRMSEFLLKRQNRDAGWGTFDKDNIGNLILRFATKGIADSAAPFDPSCPDVTGHALEALAATGHTIENTPALRKTIEFLRGSREADIAAWGSRWAVNTIFGTSAVVTGLLRTGVSKDDPLVHASMDWLHSVQNSDGGFGESTLSYVDKKWRGRGISTASQTSWALMAMVDAGEAHSEQASSAAEFLISQMESEGRWVDPTPVGTGHPKILYLEYPSYPFTFPLIALGKYRKSL
jgi:squalene-hopene/tetraprenyl-beta-curcumene cyclase